ncbi:receptor-interacting serine/threonine-protein kinase 1-like [Ciona intestinalis]
MASPTDIAKFNYKDFSEKKILGEGSFNQVYQVYNPYIGNCVVKIVSRCFYGQEREKNLLLKEAADMQRVRHGNLLPLLGVVMEPEHLCLVFDVADNGSVLHALQRIQIPWSIKNKIAYQVIMAVCFLHEQDDQIVHRNLKTSNVLLDAEFNAKVCDFVLPNRFQWISQATQQRDRTGRHRRPGPTKQRNGSEIAFLAPEAIKNINAKPDPAFDVYSYGGILKELLTGKQPFTDKTTKDVFEYIANGNSMPIGELLPGHPPELVELMRETLKSEPHDRPLSSEVLRRIQIIHETTKHEVPQDLETCKLLYKKYTVVRKQHQPPQAQSKTFEENNTLNKPSNERNVVGQVMGTSAKPAAPSGSGIQYGAQPEGESEEDETKPQSYIGHGQDIGVGAEPIPQYSASLGAPMSPPLGAPMRQPPGAPMSPPPGEPMSLPLGAPMSPPLGAQGRQTFTTENIGGSTSIRIDVNTNPNGPVSPTPQDFTIVPALSSNRILSKSDMTFVASKMDNRFKHFARMMRLEDSVIEHIRYDNEKYGLEEIVYQLIQRWVRNKGGQVLVQNMAQALVDGGFQHIAQLLDP